MTAVTFYLDLFDSTEPALEVDLKELNDYCINNDRDFRRELHCRIMNYMVYSVSGGQEKDFEEVVYDLHLDVEVLSEYIHIDFVSMEDDRWFRLMTQLDGLVDYAVDVRWDDVHGERLLGFMAMVAEEGWRHTSFKLSDIKETMSSFDGFYVSKWDVVEALIDRDMLEPIPSYAEVNEDLTAESVEEYGYFSSFKVNHWQYAVWI